MSLSIILISPYKLLFISCSTCFGPPCATYFPMDTQAANRIWLPTQSRHYTTREKIPLSRQLLKMGTRWPETCWATYKEQLIRRNKYNTKWHLVDFLFHTTFLFLDHPFSIPPPMSVSHKWPLPCLLLPGHSEQLQFLIVPVTTYMLTTRYRISLNELSELKLVPYKLVMWYYLGSVTRGRKCHISLFPLVKWRQTNRRNNASVHKFIGS